MAATDIHDNRPRWLVWQNRRDRCPRCLLRNSLCVCAIVPTLHVGTQLVIVMHRRECIRSSNTGHLAVLALPGSRVLVRGRPEGIPELGPALALGRTTLLLYPEGGARTLDADLAATLERPVTLVVPDGTWSETRKVGRRLPELRDAMRVKLDEPGPSEYRLRRNGLPGTVSTLEAIAQALGVLEGPEVRACLESLFRTVVARTLWSRGRLAIEHCRDEIPVAALEEALASGRQRKR